MLNFEDFNVEPTNIVPLSYEYVPDDEIDNWVGIQMVLKTIMLNSWYGVSHLLPFDSVEAYI